VELGLSGISIVLAGSEWRLWTLRGASFRATNRPYARNRQYISKKTTKVTKSVTPIRISLFSSSLVIENSPTGTYPISLLVAGLSQLGYAQQKTARRQFLELEVVVPWI